MITSVEPEVPICKSAHHRYGPRRIGLQGQGNHLNHDLQLLSRSVTGIGLLDIGFRFGPLKPGLLLDDLLLHRPDCIEILLELTLILFTEFPVQGLGLLPDHIENTCVALEALPGCCLLFCAILQEHGPVGGPHVNRRHLHAGPGEAEQIPLTYSKGHGGQPCSRPMIFSQLLVEADISLGVVVRKNRSHSTQEHWNTLVPSGKTVVKIGKYREILAMLFERLQRLRHVVVCPGLALIREEGLLVNTVVI